MYGPEIHISVKTYQMLNLKNLVNINFQIIYECVPRFTT